MPCLKQRGGVGTPSTRKSKACTCVPGTAIPSPAFDCPDLDADLSSGRADHPQSRPRSTLSPQSSTRVPGRAQSGGLRGWVSPLFARETHKTAESPTRFLVLPRLLVLDTTLSVPHVWVIEPRGGIPPPRCCDLSLPAG